MQFQSKVLHLSLLLAMVLPPFAVAADSSETSLTSSDTQDHAGEQVAVGKGESHKFKNAGESSRLRHRVNEAEKDEAERHRLEKHEDESGTGESSEEGPSGERDRVKDQTRIKDQDSLMDQSQVRDRDRIRDPDSERDAGQTDTTAFSSDQRKAQSRQFDPYAFEERPGGQRFSTDGSMYQSMGRSSAKGGGFSSTGSRSAGGTRRGAGGR